MQVGLYRHIVAFQRKNESTDEYGGDVFSWSTFATTWARVRPLQGRDLIASESERNEAKVRFNCRFVAGVVPAMRIVWQGRNHEIISVADINGMGRELEILTREGMSEG